eukprot:TRINITY_DN7127_c0_g1_i1.p1 TRINITY_DN7127_c0_g1~~TRINITY_DN7127_c0_g1_i1.p1  ORF type:complete len:248 (-),score=24.44 TRINITY_DN7127_c0_g1_i1:90-833(-)
MGFTRESNALAVIGSALAWSGGFGLTCGYTGWRLLAGFVIGFALYTWTEYFIHRILFHIVAKILPWPERLYYKAHGRHHQYPNQFDRVALPLLHQWILVTILVICYRIWMLPFSWGSWSLTILLGSGMMSGYCLYEVAHLYAHDHPTVKFLVFLDVAKHYHQYHHTASSKLAYGFCSPFWDMLGGTLPRDDHLNPLAFRKLSPLWSYLSMLPLPIPFYHWICMHYREQPYQKAGLVAAVKTDGKPTE